MAMVGATPRVSATALSGFVGHDVLFVGTVVDASGNVIMKDVDGRNVTVVTQNPANYAHVMEVLGTVNHDGTVTEKRATAFGPSFDMANYKELLGIMASPAHRSLFQ
eukprot:a178891_27.p1 GENE.a178891_27~~a178891_27.p1  ORF type:complete len:121 (+),score=27.57 a178891_27:43-363(+)